MKGAYHQIPLSKGPLKYCGIVTPFRGIRVYTRAAMGMPGSETALEELMCLLFGEMVQSKVICRIADDMYIPVWKEWQVHAEDFSYTDRILT